MSRQRILNIIAFALRFKVGYPGWKWPRGSEPQSASAAAAILDHIEQSNHAVTPGPQPRWHATPRGQMSEVRDQNWDDASERGKG